MTDMGIKFTDENISFEDWSHGLKVFKWARKKLLDGFGDYIRFGQTKWGVEKVNQEIAQLEFEMPMVKAALNLNSVPEEVRQPDLKSEHYLVIARAGLNKDQQKKWAKTAQEQRLTPNQLKVSIERGEVVSESVAKKQTHGIISIHGIRQEIDVWLRRVGGIEGLLKMEEDDRKEIVGELNLISEIHAKLKDSLEVF